MPTGTTASRTTVTPTSSMKRRTVRSRGRPPASSGGPCRSVRGGGVAGKLPRGLDDPRSPGQRGQGTLRIVRQPPGECAPDGRAGDDHYGHRGERRRLRPVRPRRERPLPAAHKFLPERDGKGTTPGHRWRPDALSRVISAAAVGRTWAQAYSALMATKCPDAGLDVAEESEATRQLYDDISPGQRRRRRGASRSDEDAEAPPAQ